MPEPGNIPKFAVRMIACHPKGLEDLSPGVQKLGNRKVTEYELAEHKANGHKHFTKECEESRLGAIRRRAHRRQPETARPGGELSMDLSGPHVPGRWPSDSPEHYAKRAQYFLIASYRVFTDGEMFKSKEDAEYARKKARRVHF